MLAFLDRGFTLKSLLGNHRISTALLLAVVAGLPGCGGGGGGGGGSNGVLPTLSSIAITPATPSVAAGLTQQLTATGSYSDGSTRNISTTVTWTSANTLAATISSAGVATGVAVGTASMTAALSGVTSPAVTLTVTPAVLASIAVTPATPAIQKGTTQQFTATGTNSDKSAATLTGITWASATPATATIDPATGLATAVATGTTAITAAVGSITSPAVTLTVNDGPITSIAVTPASPAILSIGGTQQFVATATYADGATANVTPTVTWTSGTVATATIGATGLATPVAAGTTAITATSGGGITSNSVTLTVKAAYAYAVNDNGTTVGNADTISQYAITPTGGLSPLTPATVSANGSNPYSLTLDYTGTYLFVANYNYPGTASNLQTYTIGVTGGLTAGPSFPNTPSGPNGITAHPTLPYVYVAYYNASEIGQYSINMGTGALTSVGLVTNSPATPLAYPASIVFNTGAVGTFPAGSFAYVVNFAKLTPTTPSTVSQFSVNPNTGALTPIASSATAPVGFEPNDLTIDPTNHFVYVVNSNDNTVSQFTISTTDGSLMPMTPATVATGTQPWSIRTDAAGTHAYVTNLGAGTVSVYNIGVGSAAGALTLASTATVGSATSPGFIAFDPSGHYAYVTERATSNIAQFAVNADGSLTALSTPTVAAGMGATGILTLVH